MPQPGMLSRLAILVGTGRTSEIHLEVGAKLELRLPRPSHISMKMLLGRIMAAADKKRFTTGVRHMKFRVLIEQDEDGAFVVELPSLPGCVTQGETREEALCNVNEKRSAT